MARAALPGALGSDTTVRLLYSASSLDALIYRDELLRLAAYDEVDIHFTLTRDWPDGWRGPRGRVDRRLLEEVSWSPAVVMVFVEIRGVTRITLAGFELLDQPPG